MRGKGSEPKAVESAKSQRKRRKTKKSFNVVTVGYGRGFVVEAPRRNPRIKTPERVIVTAAHCLPELPPAHRFANIAERTYFKLVGPLGKKPSIAAECYFVDPVADIAVLGSPDDQELSDEADAFDQLVDRMLPLPIADVRLGEKVRVMALSGDWFECELDPHSFGIALVLSGARIEGGMSGSPIVQGKSAVGIITLNSGPEPHLVRDLPARMVSMEVRVTTLPPLPAEARQE